MLTNPKTMTHYARENDFAKSLKRNGLTLHHSAKYPAYIPPECVVVCSYSGRFGYGYAILEHNPLSNRYCTIHYYT